MPEKAIAIAKLNPTQRFIVGALIVISVLAGVVSYLFRGNEREVKERYSECRNDLKDCKAENKMLNDKLINFLIRAEIQQEIIENKTDSLTSQN